LYCVNSRLIFKPTFLSHCILCLSLEIDRYIGLADILGRYLGFTDISASAIMAKCIGLSRCCQTLLYSSCIQSSCTRKHNKASQDSYLTAMLAGVFSYTSRQDEPWSKCRLSQPKQKHYL